MKEDTPSPLGKVIQIDDDRIKSHLDRVVRGTVEETLNGMPDAEADRLCNAQRYLDQCLLDRTLSSPIALTIIAVSNVCARSFGTFSRTLPALVSRSRS
jgi:hypothetical protein